MNLRFYVDLDNRFHWRPHYHYSRAKTPELQRHYNWKWSLEIYLLWWEIGLYDSC
jgi:hypothetical protein